VSAFHFLYSGSMMEVEKTSGGTVLHTTVYYPAGGAVRVDNTLSYVLGDQLGSASLTLSSAGAVTGQTRYYPFGALRASRRDAGHHRHDANGPAVHGSAGDG
jgi:hypothetical protein